MKIENGVITSKDLSAIKKLTKSKDITIKECAIAILAQYECEVKGDAVSALKTVAPYVLNEKDTKKFIKELSKSKPPLTPSPSSASKNGRKTDKKSPSSTKSSIQYSKLFIPSLDKWNSNNPELCVAFSKILAFIGKYPEALRGLDSIGRKNEYVPRLLAAEAIGDIQSDLQRWEQCVNSYSYALKMTNSAGVQDSADQEIISAFRKRIEQKLKLANLAWDAERYGPGFVAYRKARRTQFSKDYLTATLLFQRLAKTASSGNAEPQLAKNNSHSNSHSSPSSAIQAERKNRLSAPGCYPVAPVYIEAAKLYGSQCLLKLANLESAKDMIRKTISGLKEKIDNDKKFLRRYSKYMTIKALNRVNLRISQNEQTLAGLKSVPTGRKAEEKAITDLNNFIKENEAGLYRGEANLLIAEYMMEQKLDPKATESALITAQAWFNSSDNLKTALAKFAIPSKAWSVTAPPGGISTRDKFGNTYKVKIKPEMILNRNSCPWYMDTLKTKLYRMKGFIAFYKGNKEEALKNYTLMKKYDTLNRIYESQGDWGDYKRLAWGAEHGFFYANLNELAEFGKKFRFPVLLADYFYIIEQFVKSANIHRRILSGELGSPSKLMKAYSIYIIGNQHYWNQNYVAAVQKWKECANIAKHSYTGERAMFAAAKQATGYMGKNLKNEKRKSYHREGLEMLTYLSEKGRCREFTFKSKITIAKNYFEKGETSQAIALIKKIKPQNEDEKRTINAQLFIFKEH